MMEEPFFQFPKSKTHIYKSLLQVKGGDLSMGMERPGQDRRAGLGRAESTPTQRPALKIVRPLGRREPHRA